MKKCSIVFMLIILILSGCAAQKKAVYFRTDSYPIFKEEDLNRFKEITVVDRFSLLEENLQQPVAIWLDKNAINTIPEGWLKQSPQRDYPIALIGYNEPVYVFGTLLPVDFPWPKRDATGQVPPEGFSVWKQTGAEKGIIKGYAQLEIKKVLEVTNKLLKNQMPK